MKHRYTPWFYYESWQDEPLVHISIPLPESYGDGAITKEFIETDEFRAWLKYTCVIIKGQMSD